MYIIMNDLNNFEDVEDFIDELLRDYKEFIIHEKLIKLLNKIK